MSVEELWEMHAELSKFLEARMLAEKKKLERRINSLTRRFPWIAETTPKIQPAKTNLETPRPYPPVVPKYANPDDPSQVWSGRGMRPRWVTEKLASGLTLEDLSIGRGPSAMPEEDDS